MDASPPNPARQNVDTTIAHVTVYTDQARVTRCGTIALTGEERELVLESLPLALQPESVRVGGTGTIAVQLSSVHTQRVYATEPVAERVAQLTGQIQDLKDQRQGLQDGLAALQLQQDFIQNLSQRSVDRFSRGLAEQRVNLAQTAELMAFVGQQHGELAAALADHNRQLRELDKQIGALQNQLNQSKNPPSKASYSLIISVSPSGAGEFDLEVSYTVDRAHWQPLYDVRVDTERGQIGLDYLAEVTQTSEEDWTGVALTLSTAKPGLGTLPPKLDPWYVGVSAPPVAMLGSPAPMTRARAIQQADDNDSEEFGSFGEMRGAASPTYEAETVQAQVNSEGGVVTFEIGGNNNIPSDGSPQKITILRDEYPCHLEYVAVPKRVSFAYLQAIVVNPARGVTLLPGKANIFRDEMFVGTTPLENVAPGQEFKLNLGIDEGLKLERDLVDRKVDKRFMNDKRLITYAYRLVVTNLRDRSATLTLNEQLPVSRHERIKVRLTRTAPQIQLGEMGLLEWRLTLPPNAKQEITYQFTVEYPRNFKVVGLEE